MSFVRVGVFLALLACGLAGPSQCVKRFSTSLTRADKLENDGDLPAAMEVYETILREDPKCVEALLGSAFGHMNLGDEDKALFTFRKAHMMYPGHLQVMVGLSSLLLQMVRPRSPIQPFIWNQVVIFYAENSGRSHLRVPKVRARALLVCACLCTAPASADPWFSLVLVIFEFELLYQCHAEGCVQLSSLCLRFKSMRTRVTQSKKFFSTASQCAGSY